MEHSRRSWHACERLGWPFGPLFQLLLVLGQRENEIAGMRWSDADLLRVSGRYPREATKSDRLNQVPLPARRTRSCSNCLGRTMILIQHDGLDAGQRLLESEKALRPSLWRDRMAPTRSAPDGCVRDGPPEG